MQSTKNVTTFRIASAACKAKLFHATRSLSVFLLEQLIPSDVHKNRKRIRKTPVKTRFLFAQPLLLTLICGLRLPDLYSPHHSTPLTYLYRPNSKSRTTRTTIVSVFAVSAFQPLPLDETSQLSYHHPPFPIPLIPQDRNSEPQKRPIYRLNAPSSRQRARHSFPRLSVHVIIILWTVFFMYEG